MSSSPAPSGSRSLGPWACVAVVTGYVLASPLVFRSSLDAPLWVVVWLAAGAVAIGAVTFGVARLARGGREHVEELHRLDDECHDLAELAELRRVALESLVVDQLPAAHAGTTEPAPPDVAADQASADLLERAAKELSGIRDAQHGRQDAMTAAVVSLGRKVQASAHRIQEEAARMVHRHPADADVLHTSMRVDHAAAQQARNAQSLAALCGEWPGQQWHEPLPVSDVVRAAAGRITAYQRVEVSGEPSLAVSARVVEPLIHLVAELLANATQSSPPTTQVLVSLRQVQRGAVIEIDDGGVGLDDSGLDRVREIASGIRPLGLADVGEIPQLGLAVVGAYVRRHGFRVDVTQSVYGGLRAIVLVPTELTDPVTPSGLVDTGHALARPPDRPSLPAQSSESVLEKAIEGTLEPPATTGDSDDLPELPRRRSRRGEARARSVDWPSETAPPQSAQSAEDAGHWMGAFLSQPSDESEDRSADAPSTHHEQPPEER